MIIYNLINNAEDAYSMTGAFQRVPAGTKNLFFLKDRLNKVAHAENMARD
jgi:uncharacterized protein YbdZ (MbtH family)